MRGLLIEVDGESLNSLANRAQAVAEHARPGGWVSSLVLHITITHLLTHSSPKKVDSPSCPPETAAH